MKNTQKLTNKNVLITAGAQGIGASITRHFIDSGANVAIHYYSSEATANELMEYALEKGQKADLSKEESKFELFREDVIENLLNGLPKDTIFVASTGRATRELYFLRKHRGESHENDFLNIGAMGHSSSIAAGIALSQKERLVVCLDGDCAAIMHMGAFAIQGNLEVPNLLHVVMNNGIHESVGGQESVGFQIDLTQIAESSGYSTIEKPVQTASALKDATTLLLKKKRPSFIEVHIKKGMRSKLPPLDIIPVDLKCIGFKK